MAATPDPPLVNEEALATALEELQAEYLETIPARLDELRTTLGRCPDDPEARVGVQRAGHRIAGTAATIGLAELGDVGRAIERFAAACPWTPADVVRLGCAVDLLAELAALAARASRATGATGALPRPETDPRYRCLLAPASPP